MYRGPITAWITTVMSVISLVIMLVVGVPQPASADTVYPRVRWPVARVAGDTGDRTVVLQGPRNLYGMRTVAYDTNSRVSGISVHPRRSCDAVRVKSRCVTVRVGNYGNTRWAGLAQWTGTRCTIWLNTRYRMTQHIAGHELFHCLGMDHHQQRGLLGPDHGPRLASRGEVRALNRTY